MKISIFTPTHNPIFIKEAYESLKNQSLQDWEWIIYLNNTDENIDIKDDRVKIYKQNQKLRYNIGHLKKIATSYCTGDILVELDHDDILTPFALEKIKKVFESDENISMVYSNNALMDITGNPIFLYNEYLDVGNYLYNGKMYYYIPTFDINPHTICLGFLNPNHVRAYRKTAYDSVGGYNKEDNVCEDVNLNVKMFFNGEIYHIQDVLYIQRMYNDEKGLQNTSSNKWYMDELLKLNKKRYLENIRKAIEIWKNKGKMTDEIYNEILTYLIQYFSNI